MALVNNCLRKKLPKDHTTPRLSNWESRLLSKEQVYYAALDAYASIMAYQHIEQNLEPTWTAHVGAYASGDCVSL